MKRIVYIAIACVVFLSSCKTQKVGEYIAPKEDLKPYQIYNKQGAKVTFSEMIDVLSSKKVIFFGEEHNNVVSHWLQNEIYYLLSSQKEVVVGLEMMERDQQAIFDEYLKGNITIQELTDTTRLWNNFETDYLPVIDMAKANNHKVIATNIPRKYASMVYHGGFEALEELKEEDTRWIAPLPIPYDPTLSRYVAMIEMMGDHGGETLPMAQAIKDATMARSIVDNLPAEGYFLHLNGSYHTDYYEGILWYLRQYGFLGEKVTISTTTQESIDDFPGELKGISDYLIVVTPRMPRSY